MCFGLNLKRGELNSKPSRVSALRPRRRWRICWTPPTSLERLLHPPELKDEVETVLTSLLSHIEFLRDSLMFVSSELSDRGPLYRALAELNFGQDRMPPAWKKVQGVTGWWERHVSSGHDDAGRICARLDPSTRRWQALVSHKGDQPRDIHWLVRQ